MLLLLSKLIGCILTASDGPIGHITAVFFDDQTWVIRYLVVDTGVWLAKREVLISLNSISNMSTAHGKVDASLTREQVKTSPDIDTHMPISRQHEIAYQKHFTHPSFWRAKGAAQDQPFPMTAPLSSPYGEPAALLAGDYNDPTSVDSHLRSNLSVTGYAIIASDASIGHASVGHVKDFIWDEQSRAISYLVVETGNLYTGGRCVLLAIHFVKSIAWETNSLRVALTRSEVEASREYDESQPVKNISQESVAGSPKRLDSN